MPAYSGGSVKNLYPALGGRGMPLRRSDDRAEGLAFTQDLATEVLGTCFLGYSVRAITNGVHALTWTGPTIPHAGVRRLRRWPALIQRAACGSHAASETTLR